MSTLDDLERFLLPGRSESTSDPGNSWRWATVTSVSPLAIRMDGESSPLAAVPQSLVSGLAVGDRVWIQVAGRRVVVHGRAGGGPDGTWQPWTPTVSGWTQGNGTLDCAYARWGDLVAFRVRFTVGSTTSPSGTAISFSPPVTPRSGVRQVGTALFLDGSTRYMGWTEIESGGDLLPLALTAVTGAVGGVITNRPHTWGGTDIMYLSGVYEAA